MKAYGQSAGYADQALSSMKTVTIFGQQLQEIKNYTKYLDFSFNKGKKHACKTAIAIGFLMGVINSAYAYTMYLGAVWIDKEFYNYPNGRVYQASDALSCFFGVIYGLMYLGQVPDNLGTVFKGKAAGKLAFNTIDRTPKILTDDPTAEAHALTGEVEFKNVDFFYPSRPDQKILRGFNCKFEAGKTTAIVGPSGSGKSTIFSMILRFYDCDKNLGSVNIDGKEISQLKLKHYRQQIGYVPQEPVMLNTSVR